MRSVLLRDRKVIALLVVAGVAFLVWWLMSPSPQPEVVGKISARDLVEIQRLARREIWRGTVPGFSWNSLKRAPAKLYEHWQWRIERIMTVDKAGTAETRRVVVTIGKKSEHAVVELVLNLKKSSKGWEILPEVGDFDGLRLQMDHF